MVGCFGIGVICGICFTFVLSFGPQNRHWELFQAWWTIHVTHSDLAGFWQSATGIPVVAPGVTIALASLVQKYAYARLPLT